MRHKAKYTAPVLVSVFLSVSLFDKYGFRHWLAKENLTKCSLILITNYNRTYHTTNEYWNLKNYRVKRHLFNQGANLFVSNTSHRIGLDDIIQQLKFNL